MSGYYINFYFKNLLYDEDFYFGDFSAPDSEVFCSFEYDRRTKNCLIWNHNKPVSQISPLPIWWLDRKLEENGVLNTNESKISY